MAQKQFNRFGLRRDLNLSDLPSATAALNNILRNPTMIGSEVSFTTEDLEPIDGIYITNITASTFASLDGVTVAFTIVDNGVIDNSSNPKVYRPLIKIKNRLDAAYFSTGEPFFFGGDGPNARYYDNNNIVRDAADYSVATDTTGYKVGDIVKYDNKLWRRISVTDGVETPGTGIQWQDLGAYTDLFFDDEIDSDGNITTLSDNFWERGQFVYSEKLQSSFLSLFGGTQWQGFYKPTTAGTTTFLLNTTGSTIFKFQEPATQSFQAVRYGAPSDFVFNYFNGATPINEQSTNYKQSQVEELLNIYNDPTRQLVEVELEDAMNIKHGDLIYLDVQEGQVPAQRYRVLTFFDYDDVQEIPRFHIEVTEEFNKLNLDSSTLPTASGGYTTLLNDGSFSKNPNVTVQGLKAVVRYTPYERKDMKTYLNSYRHRIDIDLSAGQGNAITNATQFTVTDEVYQNIMINDFIYDYRLGSTDTEQGVRRYLVTGCSSSGGVNTVTVELDTNYEFDDTYNNDQQYYYREEGGVITANFMAHTDTGQPRAEFTLAAGSNTGIINWTRVSSNGSTQTSSHNYASVGTQFNYTNTLSYFELTPDTDLKIDFMMRGGKGATAQGGKGAKIEGTFTLKQDTTYTLVIGANGQPTRYEPKFGGGGRAGLNNGSGGGGFTGLFFGPNTSISQQTAVVIAAGGGGGFTQSEGGAAGGTQFGQGLNVNGDGSNGELSGAGTGGTLTQAGSTTWSNGGLTESFEAGPLQGGDGENTAGNPLSFGGGGGGAGYYGGGGGRGASNAVGRRGGGGGSSFINTVVVDSYSIQTSDELDNEEIDTAYTTGDLNRSLSVLNTFNKLVHTARLGELTTRQRYITIEQYLDRYVDYVFDWTFFMKDEDVDVNTTNKAWILRQRTETSGGYFTVSYKHLYEKDYEFYQIGDFKTFLDNSVLTGGTSREDGVDQRAFGKPQLITAGDQYNTLFSLLPIKSIYTPQESWNAVTLSRSGSIEPDSRLFDLNNATDVEVGNYLVEDSFGGHTGSSTIPVGTRVIDVLGSTGNNAVVLSKEANISATGSYNVTIFDHRGFVTTANHTQTSPTGQTLPLTDQVNQTTTYTVLTVPEEKIDEIDLGHVIVFKGVNQTTYCRATRFEKIADNELAIEFDDQMPYPVGGADGGLCAIYRDRGIDIIKPLETFCTGTGCAQNNYDATTDKVKTKYILIDVDMSGTPSSLDGRWNETSATQGGGQNGYRGNTGAPEDPYRKLLDRTGSKDRTTITSSEFANTYQDSVAYWCDGAAGLRDDWLMARLQGGTAAGSVVPHQQGTFIACKQYGGNQIFANLNGTKLKAKLVEDGFTNFANSYTTAMVTIGSLEGFIRVSGNVWGDTTSTSLNLKYYGVVRLCDSISSWNDLEDDFLADGTTKRCRFINLQEYESSLFDLKNVYLSRHQDFSLPVANKIGSVAGPDSNGQISNLNQLSTFYNAWLNDPGYNSNNPGNSAYPDRMMKITSDIVLSGTSYNGVTLTGNAAGTASTDIEMFYSTSYRSFVRNNNAGTAVEYVLPAGSFLKAFSTTSKFLWYPVFDAASNWEPLYSYPGITPNQAANSGGTLTSTQVDQGTRTYTDNNGQVQTINTPQKSINLFPADNIIISPAESPNTWSENPSRFRYVHYRNSKYEILPVDREVDQDIWKGLRILHENADNSASGANGALSPFILNSTNKLSVYTFANTIIESKELCCPPLDTSPPFDSSEIGLSTTILNPDFHVDGLVNVRSLTASHPEGKIFGIPGNVNNSQLPVDQKLEIVFGGVKYDLLIGNTKTF